jgi:FkbM family methyltransferase
MVNRTVEILGKTFAVRGDEYLGCMGDRFELDTVALLSALCREDTRALDVGANIGLTALTMSQICAKGKIAALEPVPQTYEMLQANLSSAGIENVTAFNFGAGSRDDIFPMQACSENLSGAFIADQHEVHKTGQFAVHVRIKVIDRVFPELGLDRLDFMKIDVEGFELEVLEGAKQTLERYKPLVLLEMNHWCLNAFRRVSIPDFRDRLMAIFPVVFAVQLPGVLDFRNADNIHEIYHRHLVNMEFMNIVAGFDADRILSALQSLAQPVDPPMASSDEITRAVPQASSAFLAEEPDGQDAELARTHAALLEAETSLSQVLNSRSWKLTAPLRAVAKLLRNGGPSFGKS